MFPFIKTGPYCSESMQKFSLKFSGEEEQWDLPSAAPWGPVPYQRLLTRGMTPPQHPEVQCLISDFLHEVWPPLPHYWHYHTCMIMSIMGYHLRQAQFPIRPHAVITYITAFCTYIIIMLYVPARLDTVQGQVLERFALNLNILT